MKKRGDWMSKIALKGFGSLDSISFSGMLKALSNFKDLFRLSYNNPIEFLENEWFILTIIAYLVINNTKNKKYFAGFICLLLLRMFNPKLASGENKAISAGNKLIINYKHPGIFIPIFLAIGRLIYLHNIYDEFSDTKKSLKKKKTCNSKLHIYYKRGAIREGDITSMKSDTTLSMNYLEYIGIGVALLVILRLLILLLYYS